jgi:hypothetical protein
MLSFGGLHMKNAVQRGIWVATQLLDQGKSQKTLVVLAGSQDLPDANWLLASNPALNTRGLALVPICAVFFSLKTFISCSYKHLYLNIIWISTKSSITLAEGINTYMHKYAYRYTYICICDSLITGKFVSSLYFVKKKSVTWGSLLIQ